MGHVAILVNPARPDARKLAEETAAWLAAGGHSSRLLHLGEHGEAPATVVQPGDQGEPEPSVAPLEGADVAISLGGDGTFLRLVPLAYRARVPVLGVNFGRLGYLLQVAPEQLRSHISEILDGQVSMDERLVLAVSVRGELTPPQGDRSEQMGDTSFTDGSRGWIALNEMVAERMMPGHMVGFDAAVDGEHLCSCRADGVLVASPTGSTAYNLSAGGPVLSPALDAMVLTPIAPHLSIDRSVVLRADQTVSVTILPGHSAVLVLDGRVVGRLSAHATVECRVAPERLRVACTPSPMRLTGIFRRALGGSDAPDGSGRSKQA